MRTTSLFAYHGEVKQKMNKKQEAVMEVFYNLPKENITNAELSKILGWPINTITPRTNELVKKGKLIKDEMRKCEETGRSAISWKINN